MAYKNRINFVVTDLDDTIWDWLKMWHSSFDPYLKRISSEYNVDIEDLTNDFKKYIKNIERQKLLLFIRI